MATIQEKLKSGETSATPKKIMETDFDNINLSKDEHILKYRKKAEIEAKLELEKKRLEAQAEEEEKELIKAGKEDNETQGKTEIQEEV